MSKPSPASWMRFWWKKLFKLRQLLTILRTGMSQIWKKMKKSEMDAREKNFFRRKCFSFYAKKHLSKVEKNRDKININTRGKTLLLSCFFHVSPYVDFERNHRFGKKDLKKATNLEKKATVQS